MHLAKIIESLKAEVFGRQKTLAEIYKSRGKENLFDYVNSWRVNQNQVAWEFLAGFSTLLEKLYPDEAESVISQFRPAPLVSTIDHHGILNHPFFINSNLIFSLRRGLKYLICFPTAGVSLNNSSWPGCLMRHDEQGNIKRVSFFPDRLKNLPVFSAPLIDKSFLNKMDLAKDLKGQLFNDESIFNFANFSEQACVLSSRYWRLIFPSAPKLIYLPLEDLVSGLIAGVVGKDKDHILHKLVFTKRGWQLLDKYFHGLKGAFDGDYGTFLFWQADRKGRRVRLTRLDMSIEPQRVSELLNQRKIYPGSLLCFLVLLYYRITCLGGFNQVNWLTDIKDKFVQLLKESGESGKAREVIDVPTDNFAEGNLSFLLSNGHLVKPSGVDIFSAKDKGLFERYRKLSGVVTVAESIETLLPEIYKIITPLEERSHKLLEIFDEDIATNLGLDVKIKAVLDA